MNKRLFLNQSGLSVWLDKSLRDLSFPHRQKSSKIRLDPRLRGDDSKSFRPVTNRHSGHASRGFTLVEILITTAIFSVGAVFVGRAFQQCFFADSRAEAVLRSSFALQKSATSLLLPGNADGFNGLIKSDTDVSNNVKVKIDRHPWHSKTVNLDEVVLSVDAPGGVQTHSTVLIAEPVISQRVPKK